MSNAENARLAVGTVVGTHGLKGDLKVRPYANRADLLFEVQSVLIQCADETFSVYESERVTPFKKGVLLRLKGLADINAVQHFVGCDILVDLDTLPVDEESEATGYRLIGMRVEDRRYGELGTLEDIFSTAAHDILVVEGPYGEVLIPAVEKFMTEINPAEKRISVDLPEGLVPEVDEI
ncbi:MAG: 16S rRNA processing protein RimM [Deltaproteobacteria bacterium]|nr:16S rRNA processing protein RimM [Deltaproteobacteria bacterium]